MKIYFIVTQNPYPLKEEFSTEPSDVIPLASPRLIDASTSNMERSYWENANYDIKTLKYAKLLEGDKEFEKRIKMIRREFNLPSDGYKPSDSSEYNLPNDKQLPIEDHLRKLSQLKTDISDRVNEVFSDYHIPQSFKDGIYRIVIDNCIDVTTIYNFSFNLEDEYTRPYVDISIRLYSPLRSSHSISKELERFWPEIIKLISKGQVDYMKRTTIEDLEIWSLRNIGGLEYTEIASIINDKYDLDLDQSTAMKRYGDVKRKFRKIAPEVSQKSLGF